MKKDEIVKMAKEKFNVTLNPKDKLSVLEEKLKAMESKEEKPKPKKESGKRTPIASKSEFGKVVPWHPIHREEHWTFIYDKASLTKEEIKSLGL